MGQVTVVFRDLENDNVDIQMEFDPPVSKTEPLTNAQSFAVRVLDAAVEASGSEVKHV